MLLSNDVARLNAGAGGWTCATLPPPSLLLLMLTWRSVMAADTTTPGEKRGPRRLSRQVVVLVTVRWMMPWFGVEVRTQLLCEFRVRSMPRSSGMRRCMQEARLGRKLAAAMMNGAGVSGVAVVAVEVKGWLG